jgi:tripartite-type tricarboxylate transporter receptor subunit TctC
MISRRQLIGCSAAISSMSFLKIERVNAQSWPDRVVKVIVPYPPGATVDVLARVIGNGVAPKWRHPLVAENRGGAGGNIGTEFVARSEPDGHTLLLHSLSFAINRFLFPSLSWDPQADFAPVTLICLVPNLMVVPSSSPIQSVSQFIDYARAHPGKVNFGSAGVGTSLHLSAELFKRMTGVDMVHVPYKGSAPALNDLVGGQLDVMFAVMSSALPLVQSGQLRALGITTSQRLKLVPNIPTVAESGVPGFETNAWYALFAPRKTPDAIVQKISADVIEVLTSQEVQDRLLELGVIVVGSTPAALASHLAKEIARWSEVIKEAGIAQ